MILIAISLAQDIVISNYKHYHNNVPYIGFTIHIEKRKEEHKENNTNKFGHALKQYGYINLKY